MKRSTQDIVDPMIIIDGHAHRVSTLSLAVISEVRDAIEDGSDELDRVADVIFTDGHSHKSDRAYVESFALAHDVLLGSRFAFKRAS